MTAWAAKYKDSRWQQKRLEIMERDGFACKSCGAEGEGVTLNVHHAYYESGKDPWDYPDNTLVTWCETCHKERHELQINMLRRLSGIPLDDYRTICLRPLPVYLMHLPDKVVLLLSEAIDIARNGGAE
jgi:5-methylcytosine-specific restriction endonuclease McrA